MAARKKKKAKLPVGVAIIATLTLLGSIAGLCLVAFVLLYKTGYRPGFAIPAEVSKVILTMRKLQIALSVGSCLLSFVTALGLFWRKEWALYVYVAMVTLGAIYTVYASFQGKDYSFICSLVIDILILWYFSLPRIRKAFA